MSPSNVLTKEQIFAVEDLETLKVDVPQWRGHVFLRKWSAHDLDVFEKSAFSNPKHDETKRALVAVLSVCDERGKKLFNMSDLDKVGEKSATALDTILSAAVGFNKLSDQDQEDVEKN